MSFVLLSTIYKVLWETVHKLVEGQFYKINRPPILSIRYNFMVGLVSSIFTRQCLLILYRYTQPTIYCCSTWASWTHCSALCSWCSLLPRYFVAGPCLALSMGSCSPYFILLRCGQSVDSTATATMLSLPLFITAPSSALERCEKLVWVCQYFLMRFLFY